MAEGIWPIPLIKVSGGLWCRLIALTTKADSIRKFQDRIHRTSFFLETDNSILLKKQKAIVFHPHLLEPYLKAVMMLNNPH